MQAIGETPSFPLPNRPLEFYLDQITDVLTEVGDVSGEVKNLRTDLNKEVLDRQAYDQEQDLKLQTLNGHYFPLDAYDFGKSLDVKTPNVDDVLLLTTYAITMTSGASGIGDIKEDTVVKNLFDGVEFVWNSSTQTWQDWGIGNIVTAGNDHLGVVEGTADPGDGGKDGFGTVELGGRFKTIGFDTLKGRVDSLEGDLDAESARAEEAEGKKQNMIAARTSTAGQVLMAPTTLGGPPLTIDKNTFISTDRTTYTDYSGTYSKYATMYEFVSSTDCPKNGVLNISPSQFPDNKQWPDTPWPGNCMVGVTNSAFLAFNTSSSQAGDPIANVNVGLMVGIADPANKRMVWTPNMLQKAMRLDGKGNVQVFSNTYNNVLYDSLAELIYAHYQDTVPDWGRSTKYISGTWFIQTQFKDLPMSTSSSANRYIAVFNLSSNYGSILLYPMQANGQDTWYGYYRHTTLAANDPLITWRNIPVGASSILVNHYDSANVTAGIDIDFTEAGNQMVMGKITLLSNNTTAGATAFASFDFWVMGHTSWTYVKQNYRPIYGSGTPFSAGYYKDKDDSTGRFHLWLSFPKATNIAVRVNIEAMYLGGSTKYNTEYASHFKFFQTPIPVTYPSESLYDLAPLKLPMIPISPYSIDGIALGTESNNTITHFAVCETAGATAAKVAALPGFLKVVGAEVTVFFTNANTAANPTLNVNGTGASLIYYRNAPIMPSFITLGTAYHFVFTGTYWQMEAGVDLLGLAANATPSVVLAPAQSGGAPSSKPLTELVQPNVPFSNVKGSTAIIIENLDPDGYSQGIRLNTGGGADRWSGIIIGGRTGSKIGIDDAGYAANQSDPLTRNGTWFIDSNPNGDFSITRVAVESKAQVWGLYLTRDGEAYLGNGAAERVPTASVNLAQRIYITTDNLGIPTTALVTPAANPFVTSVGSKSCCLQVDPITRICILQGYIPVNSNFTGGWNITTGSFQIPVVYLPKSTMCTYIMGTGILHRNVASDLGGVKGYARMPFDLYMNTPVPTATGTQTFLLRISGAGELPAGAYTEMFINMSWGF
jgi:hypothetical protein